MISDTEYIDITLDIIRRNMAKSPPDRIATETYFKGHLPRFLVQKAFIDFFVSLPPGSAVLDAGTWFPFVSWYLGHTFDTDVQFTCLDMPEAIQIDKSHGFRSNLCFTNYGTEAFDFIFLTECLEHLPCNLHTVRDRIIKAVKPGGFLLVSYPLKGVNAQDYDKDLPMSFDKSYEHLREFTRATADAFITDLPVIDKKEVWTDAYGGNILQVLYRKEASITTESEIEQRG